MWYLIKRFFDFFFKDNNNDLRKSIVHYKPDPTTKPPTSRKLKDRKL